MNYLNRIQYHHTLGRRHPAVLTQHDMQELVSLLCSHMVDHEHWEWTDVLGQVSDEQWARMFRGNAVGAEGFRALRHYLRAVLEPRITADLRDPDPLPADYNSGDDHTIANCAAERDEPTGPMYGFLLREQAE